MIVATDGACSGNPGPGGWAWVAQDGRKAGSGTPQTTNNRMELQAVLEALKASDGPLVIQTDSAYVIGCCETWVQGWKRKGWRKGPGGKGNIQNLDLIQAINQAMENRQVSFEKVPGHAGHPLNEKADQLARAHCERIMSTGGYRR